MFDRRSCKNGTLIRLGMAYNKSHCYTEQHDKDLNSRRKEQKKVDGINEDTVDDNGTIQDKDCGASVE